MRTTRTISIATALALSCVTATVTAGTANAAVHTARHHTHHPLFHQHGMGFNPATIRAHKAASGMQAEHTAQAPLERFGDAPASFDLTQYALPAGDQGAVGSCVAWATGYTAYGILMKEQAISGSPMAPMFIYSQIAQGNDNGTSASVALPMEQEQGIDTKADYWQGDTDYTTQPDDAERANAAHYKLSGSEDLLAGGGSVKDAIENAISQGEPVVFGVTLHASFWDLANDPQLADSYSYLPGGSGDEAKGGHEMTIVAYNDQGVKIENSWGDSFGDNGFFTVPWSYFSTGDVDEINAVGKLVQS